jgi:hypothetical protein
LRQITRNFPKRWTVAPVLPVFQRAPEEITSRREKNFRTSDDALKLDLNYRDDEKFAVDANPPNVLPRLFSPVAPYANF